MLLSLMTSIRDAPAATQWMSLHNKLVQVASPFINYVYYLDMASAVLLYGGVLLGVVAGRFKIAPRAAPAVVALAISYAVLPFDLMSASFLDTRVAIMSLSRSCGAATFIAAPDHRRAGPITP